MYKVFNEPFRREWQNDLHTIWQLTRAHLPTLIVATLCGSVLSAIDGSIAWLVKPAIEKVTASGDETMVVLLPLGVVVMFFLRGFFTFSSNFLMNSIGAKIVRSLRQALYEKLLRLPMSFYSQRSSGSIISRMLNDINSLEKSVAAFIKDLIVQSMTVLALTAVVFYRQWDLALLSLAIIPLVVLVTDRLGRRMKKVSRKRRKLISLITKVIHETLSGMRIVKVFTMEEMMRRRNEKAIAEHYRNVMREVRVDESTTFMLETIAGMGVAAILWYGIYLIHSGELALSGFMSFIVAVFMLYTPLKRLSRLNNVFQKTRTGLQRIKEIYAIEEEAEGGKEIPEVRGHVKLDRVSFVYPGTQSKVLDEVSMEVAPNETVAIVGYSGAGKSTLVDLLLGFWEGYTGGIYLDGLDIKEYTNQSLRSHMGLVSQDIILFDDTVRNNILFGRPDATEEEVVEAAKAAFAHDFIIEMPEGYDTQIGERGIKLSGGQKQRVSLARAFIKNPRLLILDEATSSLDAESEAKVQKALETIMPDRTTIVIAHRLSTIRNADRIVVLDRGRVIQDGTHKELYSRDGVYQELYRKHFSVPEGRAR